MKGRAISMKNAMFVVCLAVTMTACVSSSHNDESADAVSVSPNQISACFADVNQNCPFNHFEDETQKSKISSKLSDKEISELNRKKCGFGQGLRVDENNRPYCSIDFNAEFKKYDSIAIGEENKKIYLTFDQGYENGYTSKILDILKEKNVKATFFVLQDYAERNPDLVIRMINEGHVVGNHSVHHYSMPTLDVNTAKKEITDFHNYIKEKFGYEMTLFRPPMGEFSEQSLATTQACGYKTIMWSFAYADWDPAKQMDNGKALTKVTKAAHSGCIYLLHSVSKTNTEILGDVIDNLKSQGYSFDIVS